MDILLAVIESVIVVGICALVYRFVGHLFGRRPEDPDDGEPYAEVGAPLRPRTPQRTAKAAVDEPHEPEVQD